MSRTSRVLTNPSDPVQAAEAVTELQQTVDANIEFGNPISPDPTSTTLAGVGTPTEHNGTLQNIKGSWVEVNVTACDTAFEVNHNLDLEVFNEEVNVCWIVMRVLHSGNTVNAASSVSFNYEEGDAVTENMIELRGYTAGTRVVNADNPLMVSFFVIAGNRRPTPSSIIAEDEPAHGYTEDLTAELIDPSFETSTFLDTDDTGDAGIGWIDELAEDALIAAPGGAPYRGHFRQAGGAAANPAASLGARCLLSIDSTYNIAAIAVDQEYELKSDPRTSLVGGTTESLWIDAGRIFLTVTAAICRRADGADELLDEARLGVYWYDGSTSLISGVTSTIIGDAAGLGNTFVDFTYDFTAPVGARSFRVRCIAIKRDPAGDAARLQFDNIRIVVGTTN